MISIAANDLKKKGISVLKNKHEAMITVRGQPRYVVMDIETYEQMREAELEVALSEARSDLEKGKFVIEDVAQHITRLLKKNKKSKAK